jgi:hypothetical protein
MMLPRQNGPVGHCSYPFARDRAHVVAVAVMQIIHTRPHNPVRVIAAYLRDELNDIEQQVMSDLKVVD